MATDIIARGMITEYKSGTNINFKENDDGSVTISASGDVSSEDTVARETIDNHKLDKNNPHNVTAEQVGLNNVDNTADLDKPISTAVQTALDNKANIKHTHKKSDITDFPNSLPADGGNADTVNNHTVGTDVPTNALFTDTVYDDTEIDNRVKKNTDDISQLFDITKGGEIVNSESSYTLTNAADYPIIGLNMYGKSTQDGVPTPENPVDIVSVGDKGFDIVTKNDTHFNLLSVRDNGGEIITKQPVSAVGKNGETKQFIVSASGSGLSYQWWQNVNNGKGWAIMDTAGARQPIFSIPVAAFRNGYKYRCVVADSNGNSETSNEVTLYVVSDECEITTESITASALPLCGIPVSSGGNYTDSNGQKWICDELIYNADGSGKITKRTAKIDSYNGEDISTPYISTTGSLTTGATVIYQINSPQEIELTAAEMTALRQLQTFNGTTSISNNAGAEMSVKYCTNKALSEFAYPITMGLQKQIDELRAAILSMGGNV